jgi:hypothetical protein
MPIIKEKTTSQLSTLPVPPPAWLPPGEWPLPSRFLHVGDDTIHYIDVGKGPTILFVEAGMWSFIWRDSLGAVGLAGLSAAQLAIADVPPSWPTGPRAGVTGVSW